MYFAFLYLTDQSKISRITVRQTNRRIHFRKDSLVPLTHREQRDLELICLEKRRKMHCQILSDLRIQSWIFLKKGTLLAECLEEVNSKATDGNCHAERRMRLSVKRSKRKSRTVK